MELFNPSGGVHYHWRAFRYAHPFWRDFVKNIGQWLTNWDAGFDEILLIGPSSGYTLPEPWLRNFKRRIGIEPDFLARRIFEYRFGKTEWIHSSWFRPRSEDLGLSEMEKLLKLYPASPILFCNLLGQLGVLHRDEFQRNPERFEIWKRAFLTLLASRKFASFHDIYSSKTEFKFNTQDGTVVSANSEVVDHLIYGMFKNVKNRHYFRWELTPRNFHLIEAVSN